jgi:3-deoxy-D-manno-octulosonic acid kinase
VPEAVRLEVLPHAALAWVDGAEDAVRLVGAEPDDVPSAGRAGRGAVGRLASPLGPLVVREHRKGGLLRHVRGRRFHGRWRPFDELVVTRRLAAAGVPVPEAVGAVVLRRGSAWRGFLLTREVVDAVDLETWLYGRSPVPAGRRDVLPRAGEAVRRLHDAGVWHADLHPKNLLLDPHADRVLVIDLDRARAYDAALPAGKRLENLARLARAVEKHRLRGMRAGRREALRFLEGYAGSRAEAARWLDRVRARLAPGLNARVLWWKVSGPERPA